jgi:hypothetical protein
MLPNETLPGREIPATRPGSCMKILVAIANHGTKNRAFVDRLLRVATPKATVPVEAAAGALALASRVVAVCRVRVVAQAVSPTPGEAVPRHQSMR